MGFCFLSLIFLFLDIYVTVWIDIVFDILISLWNGYGVSCLALFSYVFMLSGHNFFYCSYVCRLLSVQFFLIGFMFIWLAHFTCLHIDIRFRCWLLSCFENIMCVSQPCALVWMMCYFMLKFFPMFISLVECFMLSALSVRMPYLFAYHGHDNLSHWQFCHLFSFSMSLCTITILLHYLWYCWKVLFGSALSSVCIYILKFFLNLVDIYLVWYCCLVLYCGVIFLADVSSIFQG